VLQLQASGLGRESAGNIVELDPHDLVSRATGDIDAWLMPDAEATRKSSVTTSHDVLLSTP